MTDADFEITVDGGLLSGRSTGRGPALLVLHGGPGLSDYSEMFVEELQGWRALRYTQRGTPPSTARAPYTVHRHVDDALAVLDAHGVERAVLVGHSWGGFLACCVAAAAPHRVAGIVIVDTLGLSEDGGMAEFDAELEARTPAENLPRLQELSEQTNSGRVPGDDEFLESLALMFPSYFAVPSLAPALPSYIGASFPAFAGTFESIETELGRGQPAASLGSFDEPVEVLYGELSPMPAHVALQTAAVFPDATVTAVPGAGHFVWAERPGALRDALRRLAGRLETGR